MVRALAVVPATNRVDSPADDHRAHRFEMTSFEPGSASPKRNKNDSSCLAVCALRSPVPAEVRLQGRGPGWIRSPVANGRVVHLAGPWRTTGGWWSPESRFAYDTFDVETSDGTIARLCFDHVRRRWQIDAVYD